MSARRRFFCSTDRCPARWRNVAESRCIYCGAENTARHKMELGHTVYIGPDFPAHYHPAFDQVVESRKHLRELQETHGVRDYEPGEKLQKPTYKNPFAKGSESRAKIRQELFGDTPVGR